MNYKKPLYKLLIKFIKCFSPRLYHQFQFSVGDYSVQEYVSIIPRPVDSILSEYFNGIKLIGAEIGVLRGEHAENLLNILNIGKLFLIDNWRNTIENYEIAKRKFENNNVVDIIKKRSKKAVLLIPNESLDFVYIDADHSYKAVYDDLNLWGARVKDNGLITGHDVQRVNILRAVIDYCKEKDYLFETNIPDYYIYKSKGGLK